MKKLIGALALALIAFSGFISCNSDSDDSGSSEPKTAVYKNDSFTITAKNPTEKINVVSESEIELSSSIDVDATDFDGTKPEFTLSGTFNGKIVNKTKGTILNLNGVTLSNTDAPAIYGEKKIELSAKKGTTNTITTSGTPATKTAAVLCKKAIEIGGSGNLVIKTNICHGIKGGDIKIKGSLNLTIDGDETTPPDASAINCTTFFVDSGKTFTAQLKNFKHAIKADETIDINSGSVDLTNIEVAFKTDKKEDGGIADNHIIIKGATLSLSQEAFDNVHTDKKEISNVDNTITIK